MREIKFRAQDKDGVWHYGSLWHELGEWFIYENADHKVEAKTIGQYTTIKDKNGKEVYGGDILAHYGGKNQKEPDSLSQVYWDESQLKWAIDNRHRIPYPEKDLFGNTDLYKIRGRLFKVIGNIYEN